MTNFSQNRMQNTETVEFFYFFFFNLFEYFCIYQLSIVIIRIIIILTLFARHFFSHSISIFLFHALALFPFRIAFMSFFFICVFTSLDWIHLLSFSLAHLVWFIYRLFRCWFSLFNVWKKKMWFRCASLSRHGIDFNSILKLIQIVCLVSYQ